MRVALRSIGRPAAALLALAVAGCGSPAATTLEVVVVGRAADPFERGPRLSLPAQLVRAATAEGLVAFDEQGRVVPALAERWIVTDDGRSYIFRLRNGLWRDGSEITAKSAQIALRQAIRALSGTSLGLDLQGVDDIRAMTGQVIELRLVRPMPHLLQLLAQPELGLLHERRGDGPMALTRDGKAALLAPIDPKELGLPDDEAWRPRLRSLRLASLPGAAAVDRFNEGETDIVLGGRIETFPLASSVGILRGTIRFDPVIGLFGLTVENGEGFLATAENREAIALAIDRAALLAPFGLAGWKPSTRVVAPEVEGEAGTGEERWAQMSMEERRSLASGRVARWRGAQPGGAPPRLRIALPPGPGSDLLFTSLSRDLGAVGIEARRVPASAAADLRLIDDVARYPRAVWFLNRLSCAAQRGLCSKDADLVTLLARQAPDAAQRAMLVGQAEATLAAANVFIPFGAPIRWSLVRGDATGFSENPWGWHPLIPLALVPK